VSSVFVRSGLSVYCQLHVAFLMFPTKIINLRLILLKLLTETLLVFFTSGTVKMAFWWRHNYVSPTVCWIDLYGPWHAAVCTVLITCTSGSPEAMANMAESLDTSRSVLCWENVIHTDSSTHCFIKDETLFLSFITHSNDDQFSPNFYQLPEEIQIQNISTKYGCWLNIFC